jgi:cyclic pyranopterin phosphate synthase
MDEVLPSAAVVRQLQELSPLDPIDPLVAGETAERWRWRDGAGEIGVISSVTQAFCHDCNRARLSTEGKLFMCLFAGEGHDLRALLRGQGTPARSDAEIAAAIDLLWRQREDRYSELRAAQPPDAGPVRRRVEMSYIGG